MTKETDALQAQIEELARNLRAAQRVANQQASTITNLQFENARLSELLSERDRKIAELQQGAGDTPDLPPAQPKPNRRARRAAAAKK